MFDADEDMMYCDNGFSVENQGKLPAFALEIAAASLESSDYEAKLREYASFGIPEYWVTDPSGGDWYDVELAGFRLEAGAYAPITIDRVGDRRLQGYSRVLGLYVCWVDGFVKFSDPRQGYLLTHAEERERRLIAEAKIEVERERRLIAEARVRKLEEQIWRLGG